MRPIEKRIVDKLMNVERNKFEKLTNAFLSKCVYFRIKYFDSKTKYSIVVFSNDIRILKEEKGVLYLFIIENTSLYKRLVNTQLTT